MNGCLTITRLSGYYPDPNFYSAHITACLAGVMLLLSREKKTSHSLILAVISVVLLYCGLLSASKAFIVITACLFFVWIPTLLEKQNRGSAAVKVFIGLLCAGVIVLSSTAFQELLKSLIHVFPMPPTFRSSQPEEPIFGMHILTS